MNHRVVGKGKSRDGGAVPASLFGARVEIAEFLGGEEGIVVNGDVRHDTRNQGLGLYLEADPGAAIDAPAVDVLDQVIAYGEVIEWSTRIIIRRISRDAGDFGNIPDILNHIVGNGDVVDEGPGISALGILGRDGKGFTGLLGAPAVLEEIGVDRDKGCMLEFEEVFHIVIVSIPGGIVGIPGERLEEIIVWVMVMWAGSMKMPLVSLT